MTFDDFERALHILLHLYMHFFGAHHMNLNEDRPIFSAETFTPQTLCFVSDSDDKLQ